MQPRRNHQGRSLGKGAGKQPTCRRNALRASAWVRQRVLYLIWQNFPAAIFLTSALRSQRTYVYFPIRLPPVARSGCSQHQSALINESRPVAEGVESESQFKYLSSADCTLFEGYFLDGLKRLSITAITLTDPARDLP